MATAVGWPGGDELTQALRDALPCDEDVLAGVTTVDGVTVVRVLGPSTERVRHTLEALWSRARPRLLGQSPTRPRIWNTGEPTSHESHT